MGDRLVRLVSHARPFNTPTSAPCTDTATASHLSRKESVCTSLLMSFRRQRLSCAVSVRPFPTPPWAGGALRDWPHAPPLLRAEPVLCSAYARAFREGFTLTLVSGRSVGIGAYLARLGRR